MLGTRRISEVLAIATTLTLASCASMAGGPTYPQVGGTYSGGVSVEGQGIDGTLEVTQDGAALVVIFDAPSFGLTAEGTGSLNPDGTARVFLDYDLQCPGRAEFVGRFSDDGSTFSGNVTAADCTGEMGGTFSFRR